MTRVNLVGADLGAIGTFTDEIAAWGEPGWVDAAHLDESQGWIALSAAGSGPGFSDFMVGYGADGSIGAESFADSGGASFLTYGPGNALVFLETNGGQSRIQAKAGASQFDPIFDLRDASNASELRFGTNSAFSARVLSIGPDLAADVGGWVAAGRFGGSDDGFLQIGRDDGSYVIDLRASATYNCIEVDGVAGQTHPLLVLKDESGTALFNWITSIPPWGEEGWIDPANPDGSAGWIALSTQSGTDFTIGYGTDAANTVEAYASTDFAALLLNAVDGFAHLSVGVDGSPGGANLQMHAVTGQTFPLIDLQTEGGPSFFQAFQDGTLALPFLPTADPHIAGLVYVDGGFLKLSAG